jgi:hypothetical protein
VAQGTDRINAENKSEQQQQSATNFMFSSSVAIAPPHNRARRTVEHYRHHLTYGSRNISTPYEVLTVAPYIICLDRFLTNTQVDRGFDKKK